MKVRMGFVSNSSSSSFVIGKNFMTEEQIRKFDEWNRMKRAERDNFEGAWEDYKGFGEETYIFDSQHYFFGKISNHDYDAIQGYLKSIGVDTKYISCDC